MQTVALKVTVPLSILDLAPIAPGQTVRESFQASVELAQAAERSGYRRVWYAEHHNMPTIASSATSVLIGHIASQTSTIRLGAGGVMLPNHSPLVIAEQFGTLATLYPDRIDLGLGRAPGSDQATFRALRRSPASANEFPQDVLELQAFLRGESTIPGVQAVPGGGTNVPLYILGSSLFGAQLAAQLGLPYAFASHFAPDQLFQAIALYREQFQPSEQLAAPHLIVGVNAIAALDTAEAQEQFTQSRRSRLRSILLRGPNSDYTDEQMDQIIASPQGQQIANMMRYTAVGTGAEVRDYLTEFAEATGADELIIGHGALQSADRVRSLEITADAMRAAEAETPVTQAASQRLENAESA